MFRVFLAVNIPPTAELLEAINQLRGLGRAVRATAPENLHITLRFLGDTDAAQLSAVADALRCAARGMSPFDLTLMGVGLFPDLSRPTIIWAGTSGEEPLRELVGRLNQPLSNLGFDAERRPWTSHLTLARIKARPPAALRDFLNQRRDAVLGQVRIASAGVMTSTLTPQGPQYSISASVSLCG